MGPKKIKIGVVIGGLDRGGTETGIVRNFPRLDRNRFDVVVICFIHPGALAEDLVRQGIRVISRLDPPPAPPCPENQGVWQNFRAWVQLKYNNVLRKPRIIAWIARVLKQEKVDIVHFFLPVAYHLGMWAGFLRPGIKRVMSRSSLNDYQRAKPVIRFLERCVLHRFPHRAVGNSRVILDQLRQEGMSPKKLYLLYNGLDAEPFLRRPDARAQARKALSFPENDFIMAAVGNLRTCKGHRELIEACKRAEPRLPASWQLLIAGQDLGGNLKIYQSLVREQGLDGRVRFLGAWDRIAELLWAADVLVHPSHHEGFPNAVLEAMAASLPVVASRVGGIPEQIIAGPPESDPFQSFPDETGWLVPAKDPEALARALVAAGQDTERRRVMGERGCRRVRQNFSIEKSVAAYEALYQELAS